MNCCLLRVSFFMSQINIMRRGDSDRTARASGLCTLSPHGHTAGPPPPQTGKCLDKPACDENFLFLLENNSHFRPERLALLDCLLFCVFFYEVEILKLGQAAVIPSLIHCFHPLRFQPYSWLRLPPLNSERVPQKAWSSPITRGW